MYVMPYVRDGEPIARKPYMVRKKILMAQTKN